MLVATAPAAAQGKPFYGVGPQGAMEARDFPLMERARVGSMRFLVNWRDRVRDGTYDFAPYDITVGRAAASGIRALPFIYQRPPPRNQAQRRQMANFAAAMVRRYGRGGEFWRPGGAYQSAHPGAQPRPIVSWQILNEQNGRAYFGARPSPRLYARALRVTARAIRRVNKRAEIVLGGMFATPRGKGSMTSWQYLRRLYRVKRVKRFFDSVAIHPYAGNLKGVRQQIVRIRRVMRRNRDRKAGLRITEFGWGAQRGSHQLFKGPKGQARMLRRSFRMLKKNRKRWRIRGAHWFSWQDGDVPCPYCPSSGLVTKDRQPKPSFRAFRRVAR
jgi:hypothetical protein